MSFTRSPHDEAGNLLLAPGRWFLDTKQEDYLAVVDKLAEYLPPDTHREMVGSGGRGLIMVSFELDGPVTIPNELAKNVGFFYSLPDATSLQEASETLYGPTFTERMGALEWLAGKHPWLLEGIQDAAEGVEETVSAVGSNYKQTVAWAFAGLVALGLISLAVRKSK